MPSGGQHTNYAISEYFCKHCKRWIKYSDYDVEEMKCKECLKSPQIDAFNSKDIEIYYPRKKTPIKRK
jgi:hypothetical protein